MVVVPKSNGQVRICVDLTKLNESVYRECHPLPAVEQTLAQIAGAWVLSKLDANSGFWQIPLSKESALLTIFITPFGCYCFNRLPFSITSAPEHFHRWMSAILRDLEGVVCLIDDILVYSKTQQEHDDRLHAVLKRLEEAGLTLNKEKCEFSQRQVKFLGQILSEDGIQSDLNKVAAIVQMKEPTTVKEMWRFLGMANQRSKFTPHLADFTKPLRDLLSTKKPVDMGTCAEASFLYSEGNLDQRSNSNTFWPQSGDNCFHRCIFLWPWRVLQTQANGERRPATYMSQSMTSTETRYAQIEKEACKRYSDYLLAYTSTSKPITSR